MKKVHYPKEVLNGIFDMIFHKYGEDMQFFCLIHGTDVGMTCFYEANFSKEKSLIVMTDHHNSTQKYYVPRDEFLEYAKAHISEVMEEYRMIEGPLTVFLKKHCNYISCLTDEHMRNNKNTVRSILPESTILCNRLLENLDFAKELGISVQDILLSLKTDFLEYGMRKKTLHDLKLTTEEFFSIMKIRPEIVGILDQGDVTDEMVRVLIHYIVKNNLSMTLGYPHSIPKTKEIMPASFYKGLCMVDGYNYRLIPKSLVDSVVSEKLIWYTLNHAKSYVGTVHMYEAIPERFKTREISLACCCKHFGSAGYLPKSLQNEEFYTELIDNGMTDFLDQIDLKTISSDTIKYLLNNTNSKTSFIKKMDAKMFDEELAVLMARKFSNALNIIPKKYVTKEICLEHIRHHGGNLDKIPKEFIDMEMCIEAVKSNSYVATKAVPEEFKTEEFYKEVLDYLQFKDIPEKYLTDEIVWETIKEKRITCMADFPERYRTEKYAWRCLVNLPSFGLENEYQTPEICTYVINQLLEKDYNTCIILTVLSKCVYQDHELILKLISKSDGVLRNIHNPTKEEIDYSIRLYPRTILSVPEWAVESDSGESGVDKTTVESEVGDTKFPKAKRKRSKDIEGQLDLFSMFALV